MLIQNYVSAKQLCEDYDLKYVKCKLCKINGTLVDTLEITNIFREICLKYTKDQIRDTIKLYNIKYGRANNTQSRINFSDRSLNKMSMSKTNSGNLIKEIIKLSDLNVYDNNNNGHKLKLMLTFELANKTIVNYRH